MLLTEKKVRVTKHCLERFEERKRDNIRPSDLKKYNANPELFIVKLLSINNIKTITKKPNGHTIIVTKQNYRIVVLEKDSMWIIKTIMKTNQKKIAKRY